MFDLGVLLEYRDAQQIKTETGTFQIQTGSATVCLRGCIHGDRDSRVEGNISDVDLLLPLGRDDVEFSPRATGCLESERQRCRRESGEAEGAIAEASRLEDHSSRRRIDSAARIRAWSPDPSLRHRSPGQTVDYAAYYNKPLRSTKVSEHEGVAGDTCRKPATNVKNSRRRERQVSRPRGLKLQSEGALCVELEVTALSVRLDLRPAFCRGLTSSFEQPALDSKGRTQANLDHGRWRCWQSHQSRQVTAGSRAQLIGVAGSKLS